MITRQDIARELKKHRGKGKEFMRRALELKFKGKSELVRGKQEIEHLLENEEVLESLEEYRGEKP